MSLSWPLEPMIGNVMLQKGIKILDKIVTSKGPDMLWPLLSLESTFISPSWTLTFLSLFVICNSAVIRLGQLVNQG